MLTYFFVEQILIGNQQYFKILFILVFVVISSRLLGGFENVDNIVDICLTHPTAKNSEYKNKHFHQRHLVLNVF